MIATKGGVSYDRARAMSIRERRVVMESVNYVHEVAERHARENPSYEVDT